MDYIGRAERAIRTGQPNLAMLYMRRALSETEQGRAWLAWFDARTAVEAFADALRSLAKHVAPVLALMRDCGIAGQSRVQERYGLAGPAKDAS